MTPTLERIRVFRPGRRPAGVMAAALVAAAIGLAGCGSSPSSTATTTTSSGSTSAPTSTSAASTSTTTTPTSTSSADPLAAFTGKLSAGETQTFHSTYTAIQAGTTKTVSIALAPPNSFAFSVSGGGSAAGDLISNGTTVYSCSKSTGTEVCTSLPAAEAADFSGVFDLYTGKYWLTDLSAVRAYAASKGVSVTTSTMTENGIGLSCVSYSSSTVASRNGELCVTAQGVIGYVKAGTTTLTITSFTTSVPASTFQPPAGATITPS
jgi:peptidoglycan DL-endopeptidase CwlO